MAGRGVYAAMLERVSRALTGPLDEVEAALGRVVGALAPEFVDRCAISVDASVTGRSIACPLGDDPHVVTSSELASALTLPLHARSRQLGTLRLASSRAHAFAEGPLLTSLQEVALRVAWFLEHAAQLALMREESALRDALLSVVTHDAQSPLGAILLTAPLLEPAAASSATTTPVQVVQRAAAALSALLENVQTVRNGQLGRLRTTLGPQPANALMRAALSRSEHAAKLKGVELRHEADAGDPLVRADRTLVTELLSALIGHAIRFTQPPARVVVATARTEAGVRFAVRDAGPTLPDDELREAFAGNSPPAVRRRLGFAPLLAGAVVRAHGGTLQAESVREGIEISFVLPYAEPS